MKASINAYNLIKKFEGYRNRPYKCAAGLWTIGYGHLIGDGLSLPDAWNKSLSLEEVNALLVKDVIRFERGVSSLIIAPISQNQFDALVSFSFNLGLGTLQRSTLRQKLNRKDYEGAVKVLLKYNKSNGKVLTGLDIRRKKEAQLFLS